MRKGGKVRAAEEASKALAKSVGTGKSVTQLNLEHVRQLLLHVKDPWVLLGGPGHHFTPGKG